MLPVDKIDCRHLHQTRLHFPASALSNSETSSARLRPVPQHVWQSLTRPRTLRTRATRMTMTMITRSVNCTKALTCPEGQSAWAVAPPRLAKHIRTMHKIIDQGTPLRSLAAKRRARQIHRIWSPCTTQCNLPRCGTPSGRHSKLKARRFQVIRAVLLPSGPHSIRPSSFILTHVPTCANLPGIS